MNAARFAKFNMVGMLGAMLQLCAVSALTRFLRMPAAAQRRSQSSSPWCTT